MTTDRPDPTPAAEPPADRAERERLAVRALVAVEQLHADAVRAVQTLPIASTVNYLECAAAMLRSYTHDRADFEREQAERLRAAIAHAQAIAAMN